MSTSASPLIGMTLEAADMRYLTGASLMAIRRANGEEIDYPNNQTKLAAGDRLLLVGADEELAALAEFALGKAVIPGEQSACQWLTISADSPVLGKTLTDLDTRAQYDVEVQAIRRDGKFIRSPNGKIDLRTGDQVLLCGNLPSLNQIQPLFVHTSTLHRSIPVVKVDQALKE